MQNVKNTMVDRVLSVVAPHLCSGCGKIGTLLCDHCKYDIVQKFFSDCIVCGRPNLAGVCKNHKMPYSRAWVVGERTGTLQRLVGNFKFQNMKAAAEYLADLLDARLPELPADTLVVSIPTSPAHIRERGYDHLDLITRYFALKRGLRIARVLGRGNMATQHHANRSKRIEQARSAFQLTDTIQPDTPYLILDDVVTTGSTITEASRLIFEAGAQSVWVAAIARQPLD